MYTLQTINTAPSYDALKRNGFSDIDIISYYATPIDSRNEMLMRIKLKQGLFSKLNTNKKAIPTPIEKQGTQKCTDKPKGVKADIDSVREMALDYMERDWTYRGRTFNLSQLGWTFHFNDKKTANGQCWGYRKKIYLSTWVVENSEREMKGWINTMVHEIAHAINHIMGGRGHDRQWRDIFLSFGGSGERCSSDVTFGDLIEKPVSKYTLVCPNGCKKPSHKISRRVQRGGLACGKCCKEHNGGKFTRDFLLTQVQNY